MAHPAITLSGIAGKQPLDRSMTPGYGGDIQMLQFVWPFPAAFYFLFYGILTWDASPFCGFQFILVSYVLLDFVHLYSDMTTAFDLHPSQILPFRRLRHCTVEHTRLSLIVPVVGMHAAHTGQPTVLSITDQIILGYM